MFFTANGEGKVKSSHAASRFLKRFALAMMTRLGEDFDESTIQQSSLQVQKRSIKCIEELIKVGKHNVRLARPQVN